MDFRAGSVCCVSLILFLLALTCRCDGNFLWMSETSHAALGFVTEGVVPNRNAFFFNSTYYCLVETASLLVCFDESAAPPTVNLLGEIPCFNNASWQNEPLIAFATATSTSFGNPLTAIYSCESGSGLFSDRMVLFSSAGATSVALVPNAAYVVETEYHFTSVFPQSGSVKWRVPALGSLAPVAAAPTSSAEGLLASVAGSVYTISSETGQTVQVQWSGQCQNEYYAIIGPSLLFCVSAASSNSALVLNLQTGLSTSLFTFPQPLSFDPQVYLGFELLATTSTTLLFFTSVVVALTSSSSGAATPATNVVGWFPDGDVLDYPPNSHSVRIIHLGTGAPDSQMDVGGTATAVMTVASCANDALQRKWIASSLQFFSLVAVFDLTSGSIPAAPAFYVPLSVPPTHILASEDFELLSVNDKVSIGMYNVTTSHFLGIVGPNEAAMPRLAIFLGSWMIQGQYYTFHDVYSPPLASWRKAFELATWPGMTIGLSGNNLIVYGLPLINSATGIPTGSQDENCTYVIAVDSSGDLCCVMSNPSGMLAGVTCFSDVGDSYSSGSFSISSWYGGALSVGSNIFVWGSSNDDATSVIVFDTSTRTLSTPFAAQLTAIPTFAVCRTASPSGHQKMVFLPTGKSVSVVDVDTGETFQTLNFAQFVAANVSYDCVTDTVFASLDPDINGGDSSLTVVAMLLTSGVVVQQRLIPNVSPNPPVYTRLISYGQILVVWSGTPMVLLDSRTLETIRGPSLFGGSSCNVVFLLTFNGEDHAIVSGEATNYVDLSWFTVILFNPRTSATLWALNISSTQTYSVKLGGDLLFISLPCCMSTPGPTFVFDMYLQQPIAMVPQTALAAQCYSGTTIALAQQLGYGQPGSAATYQAVLGGFDHTTSYTITSCVGLSAAACAATATCTWAQEVETCVLRVVLGTQGACRALARPKQCNESNGVCAWCASTLLCEYTNSSNCPICEIARTSGECQQRGCLWCGLTEICFPTTAVQQCPQTCSELMEQHGPTSCKTSQGCSLCSPSYCAPKMFGCACSPLPQAACSRNATGGFCTWDTSMCWNGDCFSFLAEGFTPQPYLLFFFGTIKTAFTLVLLGFLNAPAGRVYRRVKAKLFCQSSIEVHRRRSEISTNRDILPTTIAEYCSAVANRFISTSAGVQGGGGFICIRSESSYVAIGLTIQTESQPTGETFSEAIGSTMKTESQPTGETFREEDIFRLLVDTNRWLLPEDKSSSSKTFSSLQQLCKAIQSEDRSLPLIDAVHTQQMSPAKKIASSIVESPSALSAFMYVAMAALMFVLTLYNLLSLAGADKIKLSWVDQLSLVGFRTVNSDVLQTFLLLSVKTMSGVRVRDRLLFRLLIGYSVIFLVIFGSQVYRWIFYGWVFLAAVVLFAAYRLFFIPHLYYLVPDFANQPPKATAQPDDTVADVYESSLIFQPDTSENTAQRATQVRQKDREMIKTHLVYFILAQAIPAVVLCMSLQATYNYGMIESVCSLKANSGPSAATPGYMEIIQIEFK
jgi:hypothetical protein